MFNLEKQRTIGLLTYKNAKTIKGELIIGENGLPYKTAILYMAPFKGNSKRINVCTHASAGCVASCLVGSGFGGMYENVKQARQNKTEYFLADREGFLNQLKNEIASAIKKFEGKFNVVFRLNGTSDITYEKFNIFDGKNIYEIFGSNVQFYDYTKNHTRFAKPLPANYHLTFSRSETNHDKAMELLGKGVNVAMVFDEIPTSFEGFEVINADKDDLRFLDKKGGVICGLKYKKMTGKGADNSLAFKSGFAIRTQSAEKKIARAYKKLEKSLVVSE